MASSGCPPLASFVRTGREFEAADRVSNAWLGESLDAPGGLVSSLLRSGIEARLSLFSSSDSGAALLLQVVKAVAQTLRGRRSRDRW